MNVTLMVLGIGLFAAAVVGGGLKAAGFEVPHISSGGRQLLLALLGVGVGVAAFVVPRLDVGSQTSSHASPAPESASAQAGTHPPLSGNPQGSTPADIDHVTPGSPTSQSLAVPPAGLPAAPPAAPAVVPPPAAPVPKPTVVGLQDRDGRREEFWRDSGGCALWHRWQVRPGGPWSGSASLGGCLTSDVAGAANADGRLEIFARAADNALWHIWQKQPNGWSGWSAWGSLGGVLPSGPTVKANTDRRLEVFVRHADNALWHIWQKQPNGWSGWSGWFRI
jgi:hypothetical protein